MPEKLFNNKLLLALTKQDLHKILNGLAEIYSWTIDLINEDEVTIFIYNAQDTAQDELIEKYIIKSNRDENNITLRIEFYTDTKEINLPFYFMLDIFNSTIARSPNIIIKYSTIYQKSSIDGLKKFHNIIKQMHLRDVINRLKKTGTTIKDIALLDLGCGKGNDMSKWHSIGLRHVVGVDASNESILDAKHRFLTKNYSSEFNVKFIKADVGIFDADLNQYLSNYLLQIMTRKESNKKFDVVSCNFAIHYLFKHTDNLRIFMGLVSKYLKVGGFFIGTTLNKDLILKLFANSKEPFSAPLLNITPKAHFFDETKIYGKKYGIRIGLAGENHYFGKEESNEYLVDFNELRTVAFKYGLVMTEFANFKTMLHSSKIALSDDEKVASFLNAKFTFQKQF